MLQLDRRSPQYKNPAVVLRCRLNVVQLANARTEQERLEAEARRARDSAHNQQLELMRQTISASKVTPGLISQNTRHRISSGIHHKIRNH